MLEVLSEAATDLNPLLNSPPYFKEKEWEDSIPVELTQNGDEVEFQFPVAYDDDFDEVEIKLEMPEWKSFAKYNKASG